MQNATTSFSASHLVSTSGDTLIKLLLKGHCYVHVRFGFGPQMARAPTTSKSSSSLSMARWW